MMPKCSLGFFCCCCFIYNKMTKKKKKSNKTLVLERINLFSLIIVPTNP